MPVEIRELIIRTEITSHQKISRYRNGDPELVLLKRQLLEACRNMVAKADTRKDRNKR